MKNTGLVSILPLLLFCVLAVAAFVFLPVLMERMAVPHGDILTYEVDPEFVSKDQSVNMDRLTRTVDRRLNPAGSGTLAQVRKLDDRRIEIALIRRDDGDKQRVRGLLAHTGTLEFRILANDHDNKELIGARRATHRRGRFSIVRAICWLGGCPWNPGQKRASPTTPRLRDARRKRATRRPWKYWLSRITTT